MLPELIFLRGISGWKSKTENISGTTEMISVSTIPFSAKQTISLKVDFFSDSVTFYMEQGQSLEVGEGAIIELSQILVDWD